MKKLVIFLLGTVCFAISAEIRMSTLFSNGMMLQAEKEVLVWGECAPQSKVVVEFNQEIKNTTADENGKWQVKIGPFPTGITGNMTIRSGEEIKEISDVITGELWFASGQSNMEWIVSNSANAAEEIKNANYPEIRFFKLKKDVAKTPVDELTEGSWVKITPQTVPTLSAVAYFFARELHITKKIPVGIIESSWGGTPIESWMPIEVLSKKELYAPILERAKDIPADMDEMKKQQQELAGGEKRDEYIKDTGISAEAANFAKTDYDDSSWKKINLPQLWEKSPINLKIDGAVWFRKHIDIPSINSIKEAKISLGPIDDFDITYFNGTEVGKTDSSVENHWLHPRNYDIPVKILREGDNLISVRVFDHFGGGGFGGKSEQMKLSLINENGDAISIPLNGEWRFYIERQVAEPRKVTHPCHRASSLYNAMVYPVAPYGIRGFLWYQGESNAWRAYQYRELLPDMIESWRSLWGGEQKPFLIVQLANFLDRKDYYEPSQWAELREAQLLTFNKVPNTGLAVIIDIGEANDIHPKNKQDVGKRLALWAQKLVFGDDIVYSGPLFKSVEFLDGKAIISFDHVGNGLKASGGGNKLSGFVIAGEDKKFYNAEAFIEGNKVIVYAKEVQNPVAVRYCWANNPPASLYNSANLPASPFRTDDWKESTIGNR
ncbi:MAG TPA: sialate O-acetylesterase [Victivallales bacterium]|nr:sialate O-acetylesterase [Victivallales bacterium]HPO91093.1 sialate O-acetylesterase [Victivallales bacterium]HRR28979.1 sialate O-acetylesterase [Victivallales bacterium]HRU00087.1 sialate O-acetylesterase [Victivallales bacterium]